MSQPVAVPETRTDSNDVDHNCAFCSIIAAYPPVSPLKAPGHPSLKSDRLDPPAFVLLTTEHAVAFLDIGPLTRGHTLVSPRKHREKIGHLTPEESAEIGRLLPLLGRAVTGAVLPDIPHDEVDYNVVQNNGPGAAQVVPHVHYHIVPRPPIGYKMPAPSSSPRKYPPNPMPTGLRATAILFGRGQRHYRDDDDAEELVESMRRAIKWEWERTMPAEKRVSSGEAGTVPHNENGINGVEDASDSSNESKPRKNGGPIAQAASRFWGGVNGKGTRKL